MPTLPSPRDLIPDTAVGKVKACASDFAGALLSEFSEKGIRYLLDKHKQLVKRCEKLHYAECCRLCDPVRCRPCLLEFPADEQLICGYPPASLRGHFHFPHSAEQ